MFLAFDICIKFQLSAVYNCNCDKDCYGNYEREPVEAVMENVRYFFLLTVIGRLDVEYVMHTLVNLTLFDNRRGRGAFSNIEFIRAGVKSDIFFFVKVIIHEWCARNDKFSGLLRHNIVIDLIVTCCVGTNYSRINVSLRCIAVDARREFYVRLFEIADVACTLYGVSVDRSFISA